MRIHWLASVTQAVRASSRTPNCWPGVLETIELRRYSKNLETRRNRRKRRNRKRSGDRRDRKSKTYPRSADYQKCQNCQRSPKLEEQKPLKHRGTEEAEE